MLYLYVLSVTTAAPSVPDPVQALGLPAVAVGVIAVLLVIAPIRTWLTWLVQAIGSSLRWLSPSLFTKAGRERVIQRRRVAEYLLDALNLVEGDLEWSERSFAEIRAAIRALDSPRITRVPIVGLRRVAATYQTRSLSKALAREHEHIILVQGPPGSGKSVALRHFARRRLKQAQHRRSTLAILPIRVNLRDFEVGPQEVTATHLRDYIVRQANPQGAPVLATYLADQFDTDLRDGRIVLLLDSFDGIPAVLGSTNIDQAVRPYVNAIAALMGGSDSVCVVASREYKARVPGWTRLELVGLSHGEQVTILRKYGVSPSQLAAIEPLLHDPRAGFAADLRNPLHLSLLAQYLRAHTTLPNRPTELFEAHVTSRLEAVGLSAGNTDTETLKRALEAFAFTLTARAGLGLASEETELSRALDLHDVTPDERVRLLELARESKLVVRVRSSSIPRLAFGHRRVQEYMATKYVVGHANAAAPSELASNGRWRETAVALLQVGADHDRAPLLDEFDSMLGEAPEKTLSPNEDWAWSSDTLHALEVLVAAYGSDSRNLPDDLRQQVSELIDSAWQQGNISDRKVALDALPIASPSVQERLLESAFSGNSEWLRMSALRDCGMLHPLPASVNRSIRRLLITLVGGGRLAQDAAPLDSDLGRLYKGATFVKTRRLLAMTPFIVAGWCALLIGFHFLMGDAHWSIPSLRSELLWSALVPIGMFWLIQGSQPLSYESKTRLRRFFERLFSRLFGWGTSDETEVFIAVLLMMVILNVILITGIGVVSLVEGNYWYGLGLIVVTTTLVANALAWGPAVLVSVRQQLFSDRLAWHEGLFVLVNVREGAWERLRTYGWGLVRAAAAGLTIQLIGIAAVFGLFYLLDHFAGDVGHVLVIGLSIALLAIAPVLVVVLVFLELRSRRRVQRMVRGVTDFSVAWFLENIARLSGPQEVSDYIRTMRLQQGDRLRDLPRAFVRDLERLIEDPPHNEQDLNSALAKWAGSDEHAKLTVATLEGWRGEVLDELGRL